MGDGARIGDRLRTAAFVLRARDAVLWPDFHRHPNDVVALLAQQIAGDTRVDSTAHSKQNTLPVPIHQSEELRSIDDRVNERTGTLTNLLPRTVNRQRPCADRVTPVRSSATTSTSSPEEQAKQCRGW